MNIWNMIIIDPMLNSLLWIYGILGNFGLAIIVFTILVRMITYPLTIQQLKSTSKMQEFQQSKEWQDLQKKYKDNKQQLQQEQMKLYQEMGINPFSSCLPTLIQFPIIIGLYQSIIRAMAAAPIPMENLYSNLYSITNVSKLLPVNQNFLWMNLAQPERLYLFGFSVGIPVLAILVLITTYVQSKLMTPVSQPGEQGAQMTQAMNLYMPLFMGYLALTFASGLALYFVASNLVTIVQYALMGKLNWNNLMPAMLKRGETGQSKSVTSQSKSVTNQVKAGTGQSKGGTSRSKGGASQSKGKG
jgi:YidC/Oxa1 family membrane protein insertase